MTYPVSFSARPPNTDSVYDDSYPFRCQKRYGRVFLLSSFLSVGLLLGLARETLAQMPHDDLPTRQTHEFRHIVQPLWIKALVTGGGLSLIGGELWWFLFSQPKARKIQPGEELQATTTTAEDSHGPKRTS